MEVSKEGEEVVNVEDSDELLYIKHPEAGNMNLILKTAVVLTSILNYIIK